MMSAAAVMASAATAVMTAASVIAAGGRIVMYGAHQFPGQQCRARAGSHRRGDLHRLRGILRLQRA